MACRKKKIYSEIYKQNDYISGILYNHALLQTTKYGIVDFD